MSGVTRLRRIFAARPSFKPKTTSFDKYDCSTSEGLRKLVDNFKNSCNDEQFRRKIPVYHNIVHRLAEVQAFSMVEEILEFQKQYEDITEEGFIIRLISLYSKAGMVDHARKLFEEMHSFNCHRTVKSFSALLNAYIAAERYDEVEDLFRKLPSKYSIKLDVVSYNVAIHALCQLGSIDSALSMLREMKELGLRPNHITSCTLLMASYEKHGFAEGEKIWALLRAQDNIVFGVPLYATRMGGMITNGRVTEAAKVVDEMRVYGVEPNLRIFNTLIDGFCKDEKVEEVKYWYGELGKSCIANRNTYMTLVPFLFEKGDFDMVFKLCKEAMTSRMRGRRTLRIDAEVLKRVVEGFIAKGMIEEAKELVHLSNKINYERRLSPKPEAEPALML